jgi:hypothetical protein
MRGRERESRWYAMVFWEEIRRMKNMIMSASYIVERGKKKRLAGGVIRPAGGGIPMSQIAKY